MQERFLKSENLTLVRTTEGKLPCLPFAVLKREILGKKYKLSIYFIGRNKSLELNKKLRGKNRPANVLSFPYSKSSGEIMLCLSEARKGAKKFGKKYPEFVGFLVIHGMLHLKGIKHSSRMEAKEKFLAEKLLG